MAEQYKYLFGAAALLFFGGMIYSACEDKNELEYYEADLFSPSSFGSFIHEKINPFSYRQREFDPDQIQRTRNTLDENGHWYYEQLSEELKDVFSLMYLNVQNHCEKVEFSSPVSADDLIRMVYILRFDFPEMFSLSQKFDYEMQGDLVAAWYPSYTMPRNEYEEKLQEVRRIRREVADQMQGKSEREILYAIHDLLLKKNSYKPEGKHVAGLYGSLVDGGANCSGYSSAFQYLLQGCGMKAGQVIGEVEDDGEEPTWHSWNFVQIDGEYLFVDGTWDDLGGAYDSFGLDYHFGFYGLSREQMDRTHDPALNLESLGRIPESVSGMDWYKKTGSQVNSLKEAQMVVDGKLAVAAEDNGCIVLQCLDDKVYRDLLREIPDIMQQAIDKTCLPIFGCGYVRVETAGLLIIYNIQKLEAGSWMTGLLE